RGRAGAADTPGSRRPGPRLAPWARPRGAARGAGVHDRGRAGRRLLLAVDGVLRATGHGGRDAGIALVDLGARPRDARRGAEVMARLAVADAQAEARVVGPLLGLAGEAAIEPLARGGRRGADGR